MDTAGWITNDEDEDEENTSSGQVINDLNNFNMY